MVLVRLAVTGNPVVQKERKDVMRHIISTALLALLPTGCAATFVCFDKETLAAYELALGK